MNEYTEKKERVPAKIDKEIHQRMKLLKSHGKLDSDSIIGFMNNAISEKLDEIEENQVIKEIRKNGYDSFFEQAKKIRELEKNSKEMYNIISSMEKQSAKSAAKGRKAIIELGFEKELDKLVQKKLKEINWKPYKR